MTISATVSDTSKADQLPGEPGIASNDETTTQVSSEQAPRPCTHDNDGVDQHHYIAACCLNLPRDANTATTADITSTSAPPSHQTPNETAESTTDAFPTSLIHPSLPLTRYAAYIAHLSTCHLLSPSTPAPFHPPTTYAELLPHIAPEHSTHPAGFLGANWGSLVRAGIWPELAETMVQAVREGRYFEACFTKEGVPVEGLGEGVQAGMSLGSEGEGVQEVGAKGDREVGLGQDRRGLGYDGLGGNYDAVLDLGLGCGGGRTGEVIMSEDEMEGEWERWESAKGKHGAGN